MPSKYSHSVVLASYSSRGVINFGTDRQPDYLKSTRSASSPPGSASTSAPQSGSGPRPPADPLLSTPPRSTRRSDQVFLASGDSPRDRERHSPRSRQHVQQGAREPDAERKPHGVASNDSQPRPPTSPQAVKLSSPLDFYPGDADSTPRPGPRSPAARVAENANTSKPISKPVSPTWQKLEPRNDVRAGVRAPTRPVSSGARGHSASLSGGADLISVQQFLDGSPRSRRSNDTASTLKKRRSGGSRPISKHHPPPRVARTAPSPTAEWEGKVQGSPLNRYGRSFIDISDEDDVAENGSVHHHARATSKSESMKLTTADLSKILPAIPDEIGSSSPPAPETPRREGTVDEQLARLSISTDLDSDGFDALPPQVPSPLPHIAAFDHQPQSSVSSQRKHQPPSLSTSDEQDDGRDQLSPLPVISSPSHDYIAATRGHAASKSLSSLEALQRALSPVFGDRSVADTEDPWMDTDNYMRYYRPSVRESPAGGRWWRLNRSNSSRNRGKSSLSVASGSSIPRTKRSWMQGNRSITPESEVPRSQSPVKRPSIVRNPHSEPISLAMPEFGVPSIIRKSDEILRAQTQSSRPPPMSTTTGDRERLPRPVKLSGGDEEVILLPALEPIPGENLQAREVLLPSTRPDRPASPVLYLTPDLLENSATRRKIQITPTGLFPPASPSRLPKEDDIENLPERGPQARDEEMDGEDMSSEEDFLGSDDDDDIEYFDGNTTRRETIRVYHGGVEHVGEDDDDEEEEEEEEEEGEDDDDDDDGAALPPPDIARYSRRTPTAVEADSRAQVRVHRSGGRVYIDDGDNARSYTGAQQADNSMQSIYQVLRAGPTSTSTPGIDRLERMMRDQQREKEREREKSTREKAKGVLGRLVGGRKESDGLFKGFV